jgi:hypothetical protein
VRALTNEVRVAVGVVRKSQQKPPNETSVLLRETAVLSEKVLRGKHMHSPHILSTEELYTDTSERTRRQRRTRSLSSVIGSEPSVVEAVARAYSGTDMEASHRRLLVEAGK